MNIRYLIKIFVEINLIALSVFLSFLIRTGEFPQLASPSIDVLLISVCILNFAFYFGGTYKEVSSFWGTGATFRFLRTYSLAALIFIFIFTVLTYPGVPRSLGVLIPLVYLSLNLLSRYVYQKSFGEIREENFVFVGSLEAFKDVSEQARSGKYGQPVGIFTNKRELIGRRINGVQCFNRSGLCGYLEQAPVKFVIAPIDEDYQILCEISSLSESARPLFIPYVTNGDGIDPPATRHVLTDEDRRLCVDFVIGRVFKAGLPGGETSLLFNSTVLVTGGGGSIGSEICRQVISMRARHLVIFDHDEFRIFRLWQELSSYDSDVQISLVLGSVEQQTDVDDVFLRHKPDYVFHAAAYKHVNIVQSNRDSANRVNYIGTQLVSRTAAKFGVKKFLLVSTDKAVNPSSWMGHTKRLAELAVYEMAQSHPSTAFLCVRFGNVIDSSGSVLPIFREQLRAGGPLTVTDRDATRYFMSIPEAVSLVCRTMEIGHTGCCYLLDMGEPVNILGLAYRFAAAMGYELTENGPSIQGARRVNVSFIGLRAGEKMHEELTYGETLEHTIDPRIFLAENSIEASPVKPSFPDI